MWLSDESIKKPVLAIVVNLILMILGLIALERLSIRQLPDIDPPVISIETQYTGAAAQTIENRITKIIERNISGIEGIRFIESKSIDGLSTITIEFSLDRDIDAAANDVRERVFGILKDLPENADPPKVFKVDANNDVIIWLNLTSVKMTAMELTDYAERYIVDKLSVVSGVARVQIGGEKRFAMRIWLDRVTMASKKVTINDIEKALIESNVELPAGRIESKDREFPVWVERAFNTPEDFANIVIRREANGHLLRIGELAKVEYGPEYRRSELRGNGINMIGLGIVKQSRANTLEVSQAIKNVIKTISLPEGTKIIESYDSSVFIRDALIEVVKAFGFSLILVVLVIYVFLGNIRSLIIPFVTIPLSITSTFILLYYADFSLNLLTLLGLVLAIGLVVDDAIVVLENINARISIKHEHPLKASYLGTRQVGFAVVATTVVLLAVFLPISLMQGNIGRLFTEFAYTLAIAVTFSSFIALTLIPVLCVLLLKDNMHESKWHRQVHHFMDFLMLKYRQSLGYCLKRSGWFIFSLIILLILGGVLYHQVPQELAPAEDRGAFFVVIKAPEGASQSYIDGELKKVERILMKWVDKGVASRIISLYPQGLGLGDAVNTGFAILVMDDEAKKNISTFKIMDDVRNELAAIPGILAFPVMRSSLGSAGIAQPVQFVIGGFDYSSLVKWRDIILKAARNNPNLVNIESDYDPGKIQINLKVNYDRAALLGVSVESIGKALEGFLGSRNITTFIKDDEEYDVVVESDLSKKATLNDLKNIYVRSDRTNELIPISNLATIEEGTVPNALFRFNRLKSITISASLANGYTLGQALLFLENIAKEQLPSDAVIDYKLQSRDFKETQGGALFIFLLALLMMYLVLAAQFGSFIHPLVIFITAPIAITGALAGLYFMSDTINIYSQIGMIMLIGLAAKNAILMIEFINQLREQGEGFMRAVINGSVLRLRPILMTAISTVVGSIPLILATGAGSESRISIGIVIIFGVSFATILTLYAVPMVYIKIAKHTKARNHREQELVNILSDKNN